MKTHVYDTERSMTDNYEDLERHHAEETQALLDALHAERRVCRELKKRLKDIKETADAVVQIYRSEYKVGLDMHMDDLAAALQYDNEKDDV